VKPHHDAIASAIVWTPILVFLTAIVLSIHGGVGYLEAKTYGTSYVVPEMNTPPSYDMVRAAGGEQALN
jgi:hypothetical protein